MFITWVGFGVMGWVSASDYARSQPDPLADSMSEIIQHMNPDHKDALVLLAQQSAHIDSTEATMTTVDRLGFQVRFRTPDGMRAGCTSHRLSGESLSNCFRGHVH
jgi:hypothetical protein